MTRVPQRLVVQTAVAHGAEGCRTLLAALLAEWDGDPDAEAWSFRLPDGSAVTLDGELAASLSELWSRAAILAEQRAAEDEQDATDPGPGRG